MNFFQKLSPAYIPQPAAQQKGLRPHREKILQAILIIFSVLGLPSAILGISNSLREANFILPALYASVYILVFIMLLNRGLPYTLRASLIVAIAYLLAISELFESGQLGEVRMFLIAFVALTAVLYPYQVVIGAVGLGLFTTMGGGWMLHLLPTTPPDSLANLQTGTDWITSSAVYLMISTMLAGAISMIIAGLERNLATAASLTESLQKERDAQEDRIRERTQAIARRMRQLRTAAEISRAISALTDQDALLHQVSEVVKAQFELYYVGVFLLDEEKQYAILRAGSGQAGEKMIAGGHRLAVGGSSMIGWAIANHSARIALDVGAEAIRFNNPILPDTHSEIALPIIAHNEVLGAMTIQSDQPDAFDDNDVTVLEGIADSLAIALENDALYHEARENLDEIRLLNRDYLNRAWGEIILTSGALERSYAYRQTTTDPIPGGKAIQVPLLLRDETIGEIILEIDRPELSAEDRAYIESIGTQTAIALEYARLVQETEQKAIQEQKLNEVGSKFLLARNLEEILIAAVQELGQVPQVTQALVQFTDSHHPGGARLPKPPDSSHPSSLCYRWHAATLEKMIGQVYPAHVLQSMAQPTILPGPAGSPAGEACATLVIPIRLRGQVFGVVELHLSTPAVPHNLLNLVNGIVNRLAISIENARLIGEIEMRAERERMVGHISGKVHAATDVDSVLKIAAQEIGKSLGVSEVGIQLRKDY